MGHLSFFPSFPSPRFLLIFIFSLHRVSVRRKRKPRFCHWARRVKKAPKLNIRHTYNAMLRWMAGFALFLSSFASCFRTIYPNPFRGLYSLFFFLLSQHTLTHSHTSSNVREKMEKTYKIWSVMCCAALNFSHAFTFHLIFTHQQRHLSVFESQTTDDRSGMNGGGGVCKRASEEKTKIQKYDDDDDGNNSKMDKHISYRNVRNQSSAPHRTSWDGYVGCCLTAGLDCSEMLN